MPMGILRAGDLQPVRCGTIQECLTSAAQQFRELAERLDALAEQIATTPQPLRHTVRPTAADDAISAALGALPALGQNASVTLYTAVYQWTKATNIPVPNYSEWIHADLPTQTFARRHALLEWLEPALPRLSCRTRNVLLRAIEHPEWEAEWVVAILTPEAFCDELAAPDGGRIRRIHGIGAAAIGELRRVLLADDRGQPK